MRCQDIERVIIDSSERKLSQEERRAIEQHVNQCAECARFRDDLKNIQASIKKIPALTPPEKLERRTSALCHAELSSRLASEKQLVSQTQPSPIPWVIWIALIALIVLTAFLLFSLFKDIRMNQPLSFESIFVLCLILQNAVMLFFAPVIIRKYRWPKQRARLA
jgi:hypothetical protein